MTEIMEWAKASLLSKGYVITTTPEVIQSTPWSNVTRFSTSTCNIYLKQMPPALSLEADIMQILYDQFHANVPIVIDINKALHCFLMKESGAPLRTVLKNDFQVDLLCQAIKKYTYIQYKTAVHITTFLELGVPDWRLEKLSTLYLQLIHQNELLKQDGMNINDLNTLHELHPKFVSLCEALASYNIPETLDNCDFHDGNVLIDQFQQLTLIDWGETVITHPFFSLIRCLNQAKRHYALKETDKSYIELRNTCFQHPLLNAAVKNNFLDFFQLAKRIWPVYEALGFHRLLMSTDANAVKSLSANAGRLTRHLQEFISLL